MGCNCLFLTTKIHPRNVVSQIKFVKVKGFCGIKYRFAEERRIQEQVQHRFFIRDYERLFLRAASMKSRECDPIGHLFFSISTIKSRLLVAINFYLAQIRVRLFRSATLFLTRD